MPLGIRKNAGQITTFGGGDVAVMEITSDLSFKQPLSAVNLGYIKSVTLTDNTPLTPIQDETGETVINVPGAREVMLSGVMLQSASGNRSFPDEVRGKYYVVYRNFGNINGNWEERWYGLGQITPKLELTTPGGEIPFEIKFSKINSALTIALDSVTSTTTGFNAHYKASITIPAGEFFYDSVTAV